MKKASDILRGILGETDLHNAQVWSGFFKGWTLIVGANLAAHSKVKDVKQGVVYIEIDHPGWLQMLQVKKKSILRDIKRRYPELDIRELRCFIQSQSTQAGQRPPKLHREAGKVTDENSPEYKEFVALLERLKKQSIANE